MGWHRSREGRDTEGGAAIICLQYSSLLTHFSTLWQQQLTFWRWSEFIERWRAVGSRCICDTVGSQVVPGRKRPHYMECNAQSLLLLWSQSTLNHVPGHIYVWQRLTDFQQVGGNLCEKKVQNQERCLPQGLRHIRADLVFFWRLIIFVSFDLLSLEKHLKEMLVVILPCAVVRRIKQKTHCPTLSSLSLSAVNYCMCTC